MPKRLWGGRFGKTIDLDFDRFQRSISYDYKLAEFDIYHSMIHVFALFKMGILKSYEFKKLRNTLKEILKEIKSEKFKYNPESEDIHTEIQNRVFKKVGKVALKLHSFRSRNDQVAFDERFYLYREGLKILELLSEVMSAFKKLAKKYKNDLFVGYTHTQRAQVIRFKDYILAYFWMFKKDSQRLDRFLKSLEIPIGCGALAGSYIKKEAYQEAIRYVSRSIDVIFKNIKITLSKNPLSDISDRDFLIEFLSILSILQMHLSRLAEDFILYSTKEFNFLFLPEEFCTGSSFLPHKKNPDFLELVRGYTSHIYGNLLSLFTLMKGLPLTYNRDMQLDKEPIFSSIEIIKEELKILIKFIGRVSFNKDAISELIKNDQSLYAVELTEYLTEKKIPFLQAHRIIGRLIKFCEKKGIKIKDLDDRTIKKFSLYLNKEKINKICNPYFVIAKKKN